jgi:hypothetical protein
MAELEDVSSYHPWCSSYPYRLSFPPSEFLEEEKRIGGNKKYVQVKEFAAHSWSI